MSAHPAYLPAEGPEGGDGYVGVHRPYQHGVGRGVGREQPPPHRTVPHTPTHTTTTHTSTTYTTGTYNNI